MNYFPTYLALGDGFCNRKEELKRLVSNIQGTNPTLLMSPRRYGKTSMALQAFAKLKYPYAHMDFYKALAEDEIERVILNGIGYLLGSPQKTDYRVRHSKGTQPPKFPCSDSGTVTPQIITCQVDMFPA